MQIYNYTTANNVYGACIYVKKNSVYNACTYTYIYIKDIYVFCMYVTHFSVWSNQMPSKLQAFNGSKAVSVFKYLSISCLHTCQTLREFCSWKSATLTPRTLWLIPMEKPENLEFGESHLRFCCLLVFLLSGKAHVHPILGYPWISWFGPMCLVLLIGKINDHSSCDLSKAV